MAGISATQADDKPKVTKCYEHDSLDFWHGQVDDELTTENKKLLLQVLTCDINDQ